MKFGWVVVTTGLIYPQVLRVAYCPFPLVPCFQSIAFCHPTPPATGAPSSCHPVESMNHTAPSPPATVPPRCSRPSRHCHRHHCDRSKDATTMTATPVVVAMTTVKSPTRQCHVVIGPSPSAVAGRRRDCLPSSPSQTPLVLVLTGIPSPHDGL